jgi:hypothetical protein
MIITELLLQEKASEQPELTPVEAMAFPLRPPVEVTGQIQAEAAELRFSKVSAAMVRRIFKKIQTCTQYFIY